MLSISEDELLNLVAANEIRAFRIDREMKFKESDVRALSQRLVATGGGAEAAAVPVEAAEIMSVDLAEVPPSEAPPAAEEVSATAAPEEDASSTVALEDEAAATEVAMEAPGERTEPVVEVPRGEGLGTEEIVFEDEDLAISGIEEQAVGTQEITVQEKAVTVKDKEMTPAVDEMEMTVREEAVAAAPRPSRRLSGRPPSARAASMRRGMLVASRVKGNPVMNAVLVSTVLMMLYPMLLLGTVMWKGYATKPIETPNPRVEHSGMAPDMGSRLLPRYFRWAKENMAREDVSAPDVIKVDYERDAEGGIRKFILPNIAATPADLEFWGRPSYDPSVRPPDMSLAVPEPVVRPVSRPREEAAAVEEGGGEEKKPDESAAGAEGGAEGP